MKLKKPILAHSLAICLLSLVLWTLPQHPVAQNFQQQSDLQWLAVPMSSSDARVPSADWLYHVGEQAVIDVQLLWHGAPLTDAEIRYQVSGDCLAPDTKTLTARPDRTGHVQLQAGTSLKPGFRDVTMSCTIEGQKFQNHIKVGFDPEKLTPYTQCPADFDQFWQSVLDDQRSTPVGVEVTPAPEYSNDKVICQKVKIRCYHNGYIYGYLSRPRAEGQYPVVVSPPGAGVKPMDPMKTQFYVEKGGMIRLDLEIHGIDPALSATDYRDITRAFGDHHQNGYLANGIYSRDTYYMCKVYASLVRAVDYLTTLPEWDGRNILVQGNSQGAALSLVLAALDPRITAVACAHPALSDMAGYAEPGRTGGYPHFGNKYKGVSLTPEVIQTLSYYDVVNFASRVQCPVYMTWGYNDNTCPPTTSWTVWNVLRCPKEKYITPINEHWISTETRYRQMRFLLSKVK